MDPIRVDLVSLRRPVEYQFPNEKWFRIAPFRGEGRALLRDWERDPNNPELFMALLRVAVPDATDEDFESLSLEEDVPRVLAAANGKAALMEEWLKNGPSGGESLAPPRIPPSSLTTTSSTSSDESQAPTGEAGTKSMPTVGMTPSSPSPRAKKSSASTGSNETRATSATSASS